MNANNAWLNSINHTLNDGKEYSPRNILTKEILGTNISFDMNYPICYHQLRKLSYKFMAAEAYWITSGSMFVVDIEPYNKHIAQFSDDNYIFNGAYGPPFINQLMYIVNTLKFDPSSRQAVLTIWKQNPIKTKDYACTLSLQFIIRNGKINTIVNMRSNDLWLGRPYDLFNFTIMTLRVLTLLNADYRETFGEIYKLGNLYLNVGSTHIYEHNIKQCKSLLTETPDKEIYKIPDKATLDWNFVVRSLLACRDNKSVGNLWRIRP